jgi:polar amino acid transport system permease protein
MQMFLCFFGLSLVGLNVPPLLAASIALTLFAAAFLGEIWRGCIQAVPSGQWEAAACQGLSFADQCRHVIFPQALRIAIPPTVGVSVQLVKGTALASIIGFVEVTKAGTMITNATFRPFLIYGLVALIYFALCFPLSWHARRLERRVRAPR